MYLLVVLILFLSFSFSYLSESGIGLESGVFVATVAPGSPAARDCALTVGDRLLAVSMLKKKLKLKLYGKWLFSFKPRGNS